MATIDYTDPKLFPFGRDGIKNPQYERDDPSRPSRQFTQSEFTARYRQEFGRDPSESDLAGLSFYGGDKSTPSSTYVPRYTLNDIGVGGGTFGSDEASRLYGGAPKPLEDPAKILEREREEQRRSAQNQIDAINEISDRILRDEQEAGRGRAGELRARAARGGLLGSTIYEQGQKPELESKERGIRRSLDLERQVKLESVFTRIEDTARKAAEVETQRQRGDVESYLKRLDEFKTETRESVKNFAKVGGVSFDSFLNDPEYAQDLEGILKYGGFRNKKDLEVFYAANAPAGDIEGFNTKVEGNQLITSWFDTKTGSVKYDVKDIGTDASKYTKSQYDSDSGDIIMWNEAGESKVIRATGGQPGGGTDDTKEYNFYVSQERAAGRAPVPFLEYMQTKGKAGDDPEATKALQDAQTAIDQGADPLKVRKRFLENFPTKGDLFLKYFKDEF